MGYELDLLVDVIPQKFLSICAFNNEYCRIFAKLNNTVQYRKMYVWIYDDDETRSLKASIPVISSALL